MLDVGALLRERAVWPGDYGQQFHYSYLATGDVSVVFYSLAAPAGVSVSTQQIPALLVNFSTIGEVMLVAGQKLRLEKSQGIVAFAPFFDFNSLGCFLQCEAP